MDKDATLQLWPLPQKQLGCGGEIIVGSGNKEE